MQMQHHFTVPVPVDVAWPAIIDPERVAPCMPGATLTSAEGDRFTGSVKVKLGPISLLYKGSGSFQEVDESTRRVVIDAGGKDARGNGTAAATVTVTLTEEDGRTSAAVDTDLKVTGKPAQLGRGLMSEVGGKILHQFAANLARSLTGQDAAASQTGGGRSGAGEGLAAGSGARPAAPDPGGTTGEDEASRTGSDGPDRSDPGAGPRRSPDRSGHQGNGERPPGRAGRNPAWRVTSPAAAERTAPADAVAATTTAVRGSAHRADAVVTGGPAPSEEAIDLLGAAGTPVFKRALPVAAAVATAALLLRALRRRRARR
nr:SRPBCC domain-containing protein [Saccharopolyspora gregorii]